MTINYLDSKRLQGLSTDTRPTNVQTNSTFEETDTAVRYWYDGSTWKTKSFFTDTFSNGSNWTVINGVTFNGSVATLTANPANATVEKGAYRDLGNIFNKPWTLDFSHTRTAFTMYTGYYPCSMFIGISNTNRSPMNGSFGTGKNSFGFLWGMSGGGINESMSIAGSVNNNAVEFLAMDIVPDGVITLNTTFYYRISRTSPTNIRYSISSTNAYTKNILGDTNLTITNHTDLKYLWIQSDHSGSATPYDAINIGTVDNMSLYAGVF